MIYVELSNKASMMMAMFISALFNNCGTWNVASETNELNFNFIPSVRLV